MFVDQMSGFVCEVNSNEKELQSRKPFFLFHLLLTGYLATPTGFEPASIRRDSPVPNSLGQGAVSGDPHRIRTGVAALRVPLPYLPRRAGHVFCFVISLYHSFAEKSWKITCEQFHIGALAVCTHLSWII